MNVQIWCASHISSPERLKCLRTSMFSALQLAPTYLSISYVSYMKNDLIAFLGDIPEVIVYLHDKQKKQFEHYYHIFQQNNIEDITVVFLDDDDLLLANRLDDVDKGKIVRTQLHTMIMPMREIDTAISKTNLLEITKKFYHTFVKPNKITEYVCYSVHISIIAEIFKTINDPLFALIDITKSTCDWQFKTAIESRYYDQIYYSNTVSYVYRIFKKPPIDY